MTFPVHWIVTSDERRAALFSCRKVHGGRWHVEPHSSLENSWEDSKEHHRPSALGRGPTANAAQHFAVLGHEIQEEHLRFAREVEAWLARAVKEQKLTRVSVFAAPHFLGLLRDELGRLGNHVDLHGGELTRLRPHELAGHPAVRAVLERTGVGTETS